MRDVADLGAALFSWPADAPLPEPLEFEVRRRGLWNLLTPARPVAQLLAAAGAAEHGGDPAAAHAAMAALPAAVRALPDETWTWLREHPRSLPRPQWARLLAAAGEHTM